ncbi:MAG: lpxD [Gammaproteobacteria bacterium]|nr:lpxD [Gammaproteobacteria bacterium]
MAHTLREIADAIAADLQGEADCVITGIATIQKAGPSDLCFLANRRYFPYLSSTRAGAVILGPEDAKQCPVNALIVVDPYLAYVKAIRLMFPEVTFTPGISEHACVSDDAIIAASAFIGPNTVIARGVRIDDGVYIGPGCVINEAVVINTGTRLVANVTLCHHVQIGKRAILHPGVVIGADGFGLANDQGKWLKIPQLGSVIIGDDVEIGANTTIDRGAIDNTVIEDGVKIDNQVQIGHNVVVGAHTAIAGCVAVAGSVTIGKHCLIGGLSAISGHISIADHVTITGMSGVSNTIKEPGVYSAGLNIMENRIWRKNVVRFKYLDEFIKRLKKLEALINKSDQ